MTDKKHEAPATSTENTAESTEKKHLSGGKKLAILGLLAIAIAVGTTSVSLAIYRQNDIYLDRSRPGFITPAEEEPEEKLDIFSDDGEMNADVLDDYLKEFDRIHQKIEDHADDFNDDPLSNETLGIPSDSSDLDDFKLD